jgi:hemoglobin-like flavoprotein
LFEQHQELLNLFEKFRELRTREEQANSMELAEHANTVMATLDEGIKGLDNLDSFFDFLTQVGASHHRIPGFKPEYFWVRNSNMVAMQTFELAVTLIHPCNMLNKEV